MAMFGKPEWFRVSGSGKFILPDKSYGWRYLAIMGAVVLAPFVLLLVLGRLPESVIWLVVTSVVSLLDLQKIRKRLNEPDEKDLFYIGGQEQNGNVQTQNFELHVRD